MKNTVKLPANAYAIGPGLHDWDYERLSQDDTEIMSCPICGSNPIVRYAIPEWIVDCRAAMNNEHKSMWLWAEKNTDMPLDASYEKMDAIEQWNEVVARFRKKTDRLAA